MSLQNKHIFILGTSKFDGSDQSTSYNTAKELAKNNQVYYIDYPITWKDYLKQRNSPQIKFRKPFFSPLSDGLTSSGIHNLNIIICPPVMSINFLPEGRLYRKLLSINEKIIRDRIRRVIKKKDIKDFIYINSFNFHYPRIADELQPALSVYQCVDPMIIPYDMKHGILSENELVAKSDLVICTSKQLYEEKKQQNRNTFFIPNAADLSHSSKALDEKLEIHPLLDHIKKPHIGYTGAIERRFDFDLIQSVAEANKDKSFVFAGSLIPAFVPEWFLKTDNIYYIGRLPFDDLPSLVKGFDVAIIPFKKDKVSKTIFPLKLFEYLGAGKPVVASNFNPDLEEFTHGFVSYCDDSASFSNAIEVALKLNDPHLKQARLTIAAENTWEKRGREIADLLAAELIKKQK